MNLSEPSSTAPLRILLMGDYSNCQHTLQQALRARGHDVTLASHGSRWLDTPRDIDLSRPSPGRLGGLALWLRIRRLMAAGRLSGYDVVAINHPVFLDLRPGRNDIVLDHLLARNRAVFLSAMSHDYRYVSMCVSPDSPLPYSEWAVNGLPSPMREERPGEFRDWTTDPLRAQNERVYARVAGITTALYEYHLSVSGSGVAPDRVCYTGLPVDVEHIPVLPPAERPLRVELFLGRHSRRQDEKGTGILERAARIVRDRHPGRCRLTVVEDVPYADYFRLMSRADVVLDQLYSHTPAMNALLAMAYGKVAVGGGEEAYYRFIGESDNRPVVNVRPGCFDELVATLEGLVTAPDGELRRRGLASRAFVERHNAASVVADRTLVFWRKRLSALTA